MRLYAALLLLVVTSSANAESVYTTIQHRTGLLGVQVESIRLHFNTFDGPHVDVQWETPVDPSDVGTTWTLDRDTVATNGQPWWELVNRHLSNGVYDNFFTFHKCGGNSCGGSQIGETQLFTDAALFAYTVDSNFTPTEVDMKGHHLTKLDIHFDSVTTSAPYMANFTLTFYGMPGQVPEPCSLVLIATAGIFVTRRYRR
jgi:hypothetical protein